MVYDSPYDTRVSGAQARRHAVDVALAVMVQTEWLASRPLIPPIVTAELDVPIQVRDVVRHVCHLADDLDHILESDTTLRHHNSDVVDALFRIAVRCRLFAMEWSGTQDIDADTFNDALRALRREVDQVVYSLRA